MIPFRRKLDPALATGQLSLTLGQPGKAWILAFFAAATDANITARFPGFLNRNSAWTDSERKKYLIVLTEFSVKIDSLRSRN